MAVIVIQFYLLFWGQSHHSLKFHYVSVKEIIFSGFERLLMLRQESSTVPLKNTFKTWLLMKESAYLEILPHLMDQMVSPAGTHTKRGFAFT